MSRQIHPRILVVLVIVSIMSLWFAVPVFAVTEIDAPPCRYQHTAGNQLTITYKWGSGLQTSGTQWRIAFERGIGSWNSAGTRIRWRYSSTGKVTIRTYWAQDGNGGYAQPTCSGGITTAYVAAGNVYYDVQSGYTDNIRQAYAGHELGHAQSLGHIVSNKPALLGNNPDPNIYYTPQLLDRRLVDQVYP